MKTERPFPKYITLLSPGTKKQESARKEMAYLLRIGISLKYATVWVREHRDATVGLRKRLKKQLN